MDGLVGGDQEKKSCGSPVLAFVWEDKKCVLRNDGFLTFSMLPGKLQHASAITQLSPHDHDLACSQKLELDSSFN